MNLLPPDRFRLQLLSRLCVRDIISLNYLLLCREMKSLRLPFWPCSSACSLLRSRLSGCHATLPRKELLSRWSGSDQKPKVVVSNTTLVRVYLCPSVGPFPFLGLTLRLNNLGISQHCKLPIKKKNYLNHSNISATRPTFNTCPVKI